MGVLRFTALYPSSVPSAVFDTFGCPFGLFSEPLEALLDLCRSSPGQASVLFGALLNSFRLFLGPFGAVSDLSETLFEACSTENLKKPKTIKT